MTLPDLDARAEQAAELEQTTARAASGPLRVELAEVFGTWVAAHAHGASGTALRQLILAQLSRIEPDAEASLQAGADQARELGHRQHGEPSSMTWEVPLSERTDNVISTADNRARAKLLSAIDLAGVLPMRVDDDLTAVMARASTAPRGLETDAGWVVHRGVALGVADVARAYDQQVVWVAERNACLHCLAYQGHVVEPGREFPIGLTYGDHPLKPYGILIGPPLHPNCRCQLEPTDIAPGEIDVPLAREAARSVARGLSDFSSEPGKFRAVDRLLGEASRADLLPRSVRDRAARNVAQQRFRFRPGSTAAKIEVATRNAARANLDRFKKR